MAARVLGRGGHVHVEDLLCDEGGEVTERGEPSTHTSTCMSKGSRVHTTHVKVEQRERREEEEEEEKKKEEGGREERHPLWWLYVIVGKRVIY